MQRIIAITGGSSGIGKSTAKLLASDPQNRIIIISNSEESLKSAAQEIGCDFLICDVADARQVQETAEKIISEYGRIDALINSAGVWIEGPLDVSNDEDIKKVLDINTSGTVYFCKYAAAQMKNQKSGLIVNIISQAGIYAKADRSVYNASKWALVGLTKSLQTELAKFNIRVTGIYPGKVNTQLFEKAGIQKNMDHALQPEDVARTIEFVVKNDNMELPEVGLVDLSNWG